MQSLGNINPKDLRALKSYFESLDDEELEVAPTLKPIEIPPLPKAQLGQRKEPSATRVKQQRPSMALEVATTMKPIEIPSLPMAQVGQKKKPSANKVNQQRPSIGDAVMPDFALKRRQGRSAVCDEIPYPKNKKYVLHKTGDYEHFATDSNLLAVLNYLSVNESRYTIADSIFLSIDENLKPRGPVASQLPPKFLQMPVDFLVSTRPNSNPSELKKRVHYLSASLRKEFKASHQFAMFDYRTSQFQLVEDDLSAVTEIIEPALKRAYDTDKCLVIPFESISILSSHICTLVVEPRTKGYAIAHVFDPNGEVPSHDPDFPFCKSYRQAVESCIKRMFDLQNVVKVFVQLRKIPNFNLPGAAPRKHTTFLQSEDVQKHFLSYRLDREKNKLYYQRESEGICVIVSLYVMLMALCYGKRALRDNFWTESFRDMSGDRVSPKYNQSGVVDLNKKIRGGKEVLHQSYNRTIYMRAFAWALYEKSLSAKAFAQIGGNTPSVFYNKVTGEVTMYKQPTL